MESVNQLVGLCVVFQIRVVVIARPCPFSLFLAPSGYFQPCALLSVIWVEQTSSGLAGKVLRMKLCCLGSKVTWVVSICSSFFHVP